jgi:hypothetical protein
MVTVNPGENGLLIENTGFFYSNELEDEELYIENIY